MLSEKIREILLDKDISICDESELMLFLAARGQNTEQGILKELSKGKFVICDRYSDSTMAYQGFGKELDKDFINSCNKFVTKGLTPSITVILDISRNISKNRDIAYAMAKANTEKMIYKMAESEQSFEAISINPLHVIGPLMTENHNQFFSWQFFIWQLLQGNNFGSLDGKQIRSDRMLWNMVDVRDVAKAHRMATESNNAKNGSRYILSATDRSGELFTWELQKKLRERREKIEADMKHEVINAFQTTKRRKTNKPININKFIHAINKVIESETVQEAIKRNRMKEVEEVKERLKTIAQNKELKQAEFQKNLQAFVKKLNQQRGGTKKRNSIKHTISKRKTKKRKN